MVMIFNILYNDIKYIVKKLVPSIEGDDMDIIIFFIGLIVGLLLNIIVNRISHSISASKNMNINVWVVFISGLLFLIPYLRFGLNMVFIKGVVLASILIIVSFPFSFLYNFR